MKLKLCVLAVLACLLAACSSVRETGVSEDGDIRQISLPIAGEMEIPADPERVVLMRPIDAGNALLLDADIAGVNKGLADNDYIDEMLDENVEYIEFGDVETIEALSPDLIVTYAGDEYIDEYEKVAPTVPLNYQVGFFNTYRDRIYLNQLQFLGVLLNRQDEADEIAGNWLDVITVHRRDLPVDTSEENALVLVENGEGTYNVYGRFQSFGTEAVYDVLDFNISDSVQDTIAEGALTDYSTDELSDMETDYIFINVREEDAAEVREEFSDALGIDEEKVIMMNYTDFEVNDLKSVRRQTEEIVDALQQVER